MKGQVKSPIEIMIEILVVIFLGFVQLLIVISKLLYELYISFRIMAHTNFVGFFFALFLGGIIIFFTGKYIFGSTASVIKILVIYIIIVAFLMTVLA